MSTAATYQSEKDFAATYLSLLAVSDSTGTAPNSKKDPRELRGIGVKLPPLPIVKKSTKRADSASAICRCSFKSIKPPKFNITLDARSTDTIYQVKSALCETPELEGYQTSSIKLLLKGKVIQDSSLVKELGLTTDEIMFTAIVGPKPEVVPDPTVETSATINEEEQQLPWDEIESLLNSKGFEGKATIQRLQKGWELAKQIK